MRWLPVLWAAAGCTVSQKDVQPDAAPADTAASDFADSVPFDGTGTFQLEVVPPRGDEPGDASILGTVLDGPTLSHFVWEVRATDGSCELRAPRVPFCDPTCPSTEACIDDGVCQPYPTVVDVGPVTVSGVQTTSGATQFTMEPIAGYYQPAASIDLADPPFAEGDTVTFAAHGNAVAAPFTMTATGIAPLEVPHDTLTFADGESVELRWTPGSRPDLTVMNISVNVSYHAGTKGIIACQTPDTGTLELSGALLDDLKSLGLSGWPIVVYSRTSLGTTDPNVDVDLIVESSATRDIDIPGLTSCNSDADCPDGQTCQPDFQCG